MPTADDQHGDDTLLKQALQTNLDPCCPTIPHLTDNLHRRHLSKA
jgi:hypothetical protein